ncbi:MAG TPA: glycosyltransferase family 4 protein [Arcobacter sp.]|nr:glycosyltransferase family 4 protein [Arcobacter sp.]
MKIVLVISSLTSGGAERVLTTLANYWSEKGWDVTILAILSHDQGFYKLHKNIEVQSLDIRYKNPILNTFWYLYGIRKIVKTINPNYIVSFISAVNIYTLLSLIGLKKTVVISERNYYNVLKSKPWRLLRRITYPLTKGLVVLSKEDDEYYTYVQNKKMIFNPLLVENLPKCHLEEKEKLIIAVGTLTEQKGFDRLIKSIVGIEMSDWHVEIIGEGPKREELMTLIHSLELGDKVSLVGRKSNIYEYYKKASIFVLSSRWEGFPNVLAEAMAHGCACIAYDCKTGPSSIIDHGDSGYLVEEGNILALNERISEVIFDEKIREKFFFNALKIREVLNVENIAREWESYLISLSQEKGKL